MSLLTEIQRIEASLMEAIADAEATLAELRAGRKVPTQRGAPNVDPVGPTNGRTVFIFTGRI